MIVVRAFALIILFAACRISGAGAIVPPVLMQLELVGIPGDSVDSKHPGTIDVRSYSLDVSSSSSLLPTVSVGRVQFGSLNLVKGIDKATPKLFSSLASGQHFTKATLYVRPTNSTNDLYKIILQDVVIVSLRNGVAVGAEPPSENFSLLYGQIQWSYQELDPKGGLSGAPVVTGWDVTANKRSP